MTSTITSSGVPGVHQTPAFAIPSTQNTAPVLEYRCLYTHDLRRRQKRWQDGVLRFHTFNKRIMVYDVSRNYIGDMHWRQNEILRDGDEFELDRGVLIQVGEAIGSMEQDLTGLFEKKKKAPEVMIHEEVPPQPLVIPTARPTAAQTSQLRPKTLNALLGTPKGRIGRAALPTKSPHELRTENENLSWGQHQPAKRQRTESQMERRAQTNKMLPRREYSNSQNPHEGMNKPVPAAESHEGMNRPIIRAESHEGKPMPTNLCNSSLPNAVDPVNMLPQPCGPRKQIDTDDEVSKRQIEPVAKKRSSGSGSSKSAAQQKRSSDQDSQVSPRATKVARRPGHELETGYASTKTITKPIEFASDEDATSTNQPPKKRSKLMIASRKPRKKLMYQDLLPQGVALIDRFSGDVSVLDRSSGNRSTSGKPEKRKKDPMTEFHREEQDRLKARLNRHCTKEIQWETEREQFCGDAPEDLFLSQEPIDTISVDHHRTKERDADERISKSLITGCRRRNTEPVTSQSRHSPSQESLQKIIPRPSHSIHSTAMTLAKMDEILFPRAQTRNSGFVEDKDVLTNVFPQEPSPPSVPKTPPDVVSTPFAPKNQPSSSPGFQTQGRIPSSKDLAREEINILSRPNPDSLSAFAKAVQPKLQAAKRRKPFSPTSDPYLSSIGQPSRPPAVSVSASSPPKDCPVSAPGQSGIHPTESPTPQPPNAAVPPIPNAEPNPALAFSKIVAPKPPPAPDPPPRRRLTNQPPFTKLTPNIPTPTFPDEETVEIPSSQQPLTSPAPSPPHPPKRKPDSLPAFTKVIPTKPRSALKKSISDTSAMQSLSALPISGRKKEKEKTLLESTSVNDERAGLWNKEAWDLFGCGRDGVECSYEEFKQKEGLL